MRPNIKSCVSVVIMILLTVCTAVLLYGGTGSGIISVCIISFNVSEHIIDMRVTPEEPLQRLSHELAVVEYGLPLATTAGRVLGNAARCWK